MFAGPMCRRLRPTVLASPILRTIRAASTPRPRALETHVASLLSSSSVRLYPTRSGEHRKRPVKHLSSQQKLAWQLPHGWEAVIGVECHAQIKGPTKLFSATPLPTPQSQHNTLVSPYDAAHPGTLPLLQRTAVDKALRAALILHCEVVEVSRFDRKHYFYPDLTMGYQITQKYGESPTACEASVAHFADVRILCPFAVQCHSQRMATFTCATMKGIYHYLTQR